MSNKNDPKSKQTEDENALEDRLKQVEAPENPNPAKAGSEIEDAEVLGDPTDTPETDTPEADTLGSDTPDDDTPDADTLAASEDSAPWGTGGTDDSDTLASADTLSGETLSDDDSSSRNNDHSTLVTTPPPVKETVVERKGGFVPMVLGGIVAAGLGYGAAYYMTLDDSFESETRSSLQAQSDKIGAVEGQVSTLSEDISTRIDGVSTEIAGTRDALTQAETSIGALDERLTNAEALRDDLGALETRLTELAKKPIADTVSREAIAAYESELERLRGSMEEQRKAIEDTIAAEKAKIEQIAQDATQMEERALEEGRLAAARSAMTRVISALDSGDPYAEALADLAKTIDDPLEALQASAAEGVVTQSELRETFPDAARAALRASRTAASDTDGSGGIGGVLEKMFEVRSVAPRDGADTDAILSRAEAAVRNGNIRTALEEIAALPDEAKEPLAQWVADAETRIAALEEANAVAARLNQG
ncbi:MULTISPECIES: hypothetical protein [unclassified Marinovum]